MEYPRVPHSHIVPAGYLKAWAVEKQIRAYRRAEPGGRQIGVRDAGVRTNFYRRERPRTGEKTYDIEWSLSELDNAAIPVLDRVRAGEWPLSVEEKVGLAQLWSAQLLRTPMFKDWHTEFVSKQADALYADGHLVVKDGRLPEEVRELVRAGLASSTEHLVRVLAMSRTLGEIFGSMHWSLVVFDKPCLLTSDQPITVWPLRRGCVRATANDINAGVLETLEASGADQSVGASSHTWRTAPDTVRRSTAMAGMRRPPTGSRSLTRMSVVHASQVRRVPGARRKAPPLSAELMNGYDASVAAASDLRERVSGHTKSNMGRNRLHDPERTCSRSRQKRQPRLRPRSSGSRYRAAGQRRDNSPRRRGS